jgi:hypothetical protein
MSYIDPDDTPPDDLEALGVWPSVSDRCDEWARALDGALTQRVGDGWECTGHGSAGWGPTKHGAQQAWLRLRKATERSRPVVEMDSAQQEQ